VCVCEWKFGGIMCVLNGRMKVMCVGEWTYGSNVCVGEWTYEVKVCIDE